MRNRRHPDPVNLTDASPGHGPEHHLTSERMQQLIGQQQVIRVVPHRAETGAERPTAPESVAFVDLARVTGQPGPGDGLSARHRGQSPAHRGDRSLPRQRARHGALPARGGRSGTDRPPALPRLQARTGGGAMQGGHSMGPAIFDGRGLGAMFSTLRPTSQRLSRCPAPPSAPCGAGAAPSSTSPPSSG